MRRTLLLIILAGLICACQAIDTVLTELGTEIVAYDESIRINNCGGKAESKQTAERTFSSTIESSTSITAGYKQIIEGELAAKYGQYREAKKTHEIVAPPGTNMEFKLRWTENEYSGDATINEKNGTYRIRVPISVEQISAIDNGCTNHLGVQPAQPLVEMPSLSPDTDNTDIEIQVGPYWGWRNEFNAETLMLNILTNGQCLENIVVIVDDENLIASRIVDRGDLHFQEDTITFAGTAGMSCNYTVGTNVVRPKRYFSVPGTTYGVNLPPKTPYEWCYQSPINSWSQCGVESIDDCDDRYFVQEIANPGQEFTYTRCPIGEIKYSIQVDDLLTQIVLECPSLERRQIGFSKNKELSDGEMLPTYDSEQFSSFPGCKVEITVVNTIADQSGYTIRQEIIGNVASSQQSLAANCFVIDDIPNLDNHQAYIDWFNRIFERSVPQQIRREPATGQYTPGTYLVLGTLWSEYNGRLELLGPNSALGDTSQQITGVAKWVVVSGDGVLGGSGGRAFPICELK